MLRPAKLIKLRTILGAVVQEVLPRLKDFTLNEWVWVNCCGRLRQTNRNLVRTDVFIFVVIGNDGLVVGFDMPSGTGEFNRLIVLLKCQIRVRVDGIHDATDELKNNLADEDAGRFLDIIVVVVDLHLALDLQVPSAMLRRMPQSCHEYNVLIYGWLVIASQQGNIAAS